MKKLLLALVCVLLSSTSYAQQLEKESIYVTTVSDVVGADVCQLVTDVLHEYLIDKYNVRLVDGKASNAYSVEKLKELAYENSGAVKSDEIKMIGKELGVDLLCVVQIAKYSIGDEFYFRSAIYETERGIGRKAVKYPDFNKGDVQKLVKINDIRVLQAVGAVLLDRLQVSGMSEQSKRGIQYLKDTETKIDEENRQMNDTKEEKEEEEKRNRREVDTAAAFSSLAMPGLGLVLKGHNEGYAYLGAEAALCLGGVLAPEMMRKRYKALRDAPGVSAQNKIAYTDRINACRAVSISCGVCAGLLHIANVIHSAVAKPKENAKLSYAFVPMGSTNINSGSNLGVGVSLAYRF